MCVTSLTVPVCDALGRGCGSPAPSIFPLVQVLQVEMLWLHSAVKDLHSDKPECFKTISLLKKFKSGIPEITCEIDYFGSL